MRTLMNNCILILCKTHEIKGRRPRYVNLWSFSKIAKWLLSKGVPQKKIDILLEIYQIARFG